MDPHNALSGLDPARKKAFSLLEEFKNFALKGNVIDLAVGVIIGAAFSTVVKSLVDNIMMPLISAITGSTPAGTEAAKQGFRAWNIDVRGNDIHVGLFLADIVNFILVAFALFICIQKFLGFVLRYKKDEAVAPPPPTKDQELLTEIRDLLKEKPPG
jgi:large conductance mechanosensitive channel